MRDLGVAMPALENALRRLGSLKVDHIREIKARRSPPGAVRLVCEAVCIMFDTRPVRKADPNAPGRTMLDYWEPFVKEHLRDPKGLLDALSQYDKDNIDEKVIRKIQPYIEREDFEPDLIGRVSVACAALCAWVRAMYVYHFVAKAVEPKRLALQAAEAETQELQERRKLFLDRAGAERQE